MGKLKWIVGGAAAVVVGVGVAGVAILSSIDVNQYKPQITAAVKDATGRDLSLTGNLELEISLSPRVVVEGVSLANAEWGSRPEMVTINRLAAQMALLPLLSGEFRIEELVVLDPDILLETDASGQGNWAFGTAEPAEAEKPAESGGGGGGLPKAVLESVRIENARFTYKDGVTNQETAIVIDQMIGGADSLDSPLELLFKGSYNANPIELTGTLGSANALLEEQPFPVDLKVTAGGATVGVNGTIQNPMAGKGLNLALSLAGENIADLAAVAGAELHRMGPYSVTGTLKDGENSYTLDGLNVTVGSSDLSGSVTANIGGAVPAVDVALTSNLLDLADFTPPSDGAAEPTPAAADSTPADPNAKVFPQDPLPVDGLKAVNANVSFDGKLIKGPSFAFKDVGLKANLEGGMLKVAPLSFDVGGGLLTTTLDFDARKLPASLALTVGGNNLGLGDMMKETETTDLIGGASTQIDINLRGSGSSVAALMASLNGKALVDVGEGRINNKFVNFAGGDILNEIGGAINPFAEQEDYTALACAVVNLDFVNGVIEYDKNIAVQTDKMNVVSSGKVDLTSEEMNVGVSPEPRPETADLGLNLGGIASLIRVQGTFANPGVGVDALEAGKAALGVASAIATGGVSLLVGGLMDKATADSAPCDTAKGIESSSSSSSGGSAPAAEQKSDEPSNPAEAIGGAIKGLFGN